MRRAQIRREKCQIYELLLMKILKCDKLVLDKFYYILQDSKKIFGDKVSNTALEELTAKLETNKIDLLESILSYIILNYLEELTAGEDLSESLFDKLLDIEFLDPNLRFSLDDFESLDVSIEQKQELVNRSNRLLDSIRTPKFNLGILSDSLIEYYNSGYISKALIRELMSGIEDNLSRYEKVIRKRVKNDTLILDKNRIDNKEIKDREGLAERLKQILKLSMNERPRELVSAFQYIFDEITYPSL